MAICLLFPRSIYSMSFCFLDFVCTYVYLSFLSSTGILLLLIGPSSPICLYHLPVNLVLLCTCLYLAPSYSFSTCLYSLACLSVPPIYLYLYLA